MIRIPRRALGSLLLSVAIVLASGAVYRAAGEAPPLSLDGFMDEALPEATADETELPVDNAACHVCHVNYKDEPLALTHAREEIGCVDCHGESNDHRNDEDNITPPERMYAAQDIDKMCGECHKEHNAPAREVIKRWQKRCPSKTDARTISCTDCHFNHRLPRRSVRWDKKTGKLLKQR